MQSHPIRIGILLTNLGGMDTRALKYLVLYQNTIQETFEFQFLPAPEGDPYLERLDFLHPLDRSLIENEAEEFVLRYRKWLEEFASGYDLNVEPLDSIVMLSVARFDDNYFLTGRNGWDVVALGNWERHMAPPSIVEFFLAMIVRLAIDAACEAGFPGRHPSIKGCVFDFSATIEDSRLPVLTGFLCAQCRRHIESSTSHQVVVDAQKLLQKQWLGDAAHPTDVANTAKKLGYDLFHTTGVKPSWRERFRSIVEQEAIANVCKVIGAVIIAALLLWLGLKGE